jgi:hypothetical protein
MSTFKNSNKLATVGHLRAQSLASAASAQTTGLWEAAGKCRAYLAVCQTATLSAGTATYKFQAAADADGTTAADITGAGTLVHAAAGSVGVLELPVGLIPAAKPFISVVCTTAAGTGICGATVIMLDSNFSG